MRHVLQKATVAITLFGGAATAQETCSDPATFRVTVLGSGVPVPSIDRFGPATLVQVGGKTLLFDVGRGASQRLWQIGIPLGKVDAAFLTHFHSDHTVGLPDLLMTGWLFPVFGQRKGPLALYGPEGVEALATGIEAAWASDVAIRTVDEGADPAGSQFDVHTFTEGVVYDDGGIKVTAFPVEHGEHIKPAYGFAIDFDGRRAVISGDTRYDPRVVKEAREADLLLHSVVAISDAAIASNPQLQRIEDHMATPEDVGRIAAEARAKLVAFTHIGQVPPNAPTTDEILAQAKAVYDGPIVLSDDLTCFVIGADVSTGTRVAPPR
ncbi:MBL fold metallo-hydrolase [Aminobacter sp. MSH1]|uniref:MBL fold metallo-hydrolase n=1 Tax=Aminobacter sp. MSH1 TaxID=374606 RepID=UPI000D35B86D|nr:MBL fold metallo-hydrolase [Aminobacter sp. MSH1]